MKKQIIILGAAESGLGAAILAKKEGYDVFVSDAGTIRDPFRAELESRDIPYEENGHTEARILQADEIVKSPGIPEKAPVMYKIRQAGIPVISEIELAYRHKGSSRIIAITGSNGKTTTATLMHHIMHTGGADAALVGNIGNSFAAQVADDPKEWYVVEVSSFQLDDIKTFRPDIAILTNITEDHLDRYDYKVENYIRSKFRIAENQEADDVLIYNADDKTTADYINNYPIKSQKLPITMSKEIQEGGYLRNARLHLKWKEEEVEFKVEDFALKGQHNLYNGMSAGVGGVVARIRKDSIREAMQTIQSIEHRLEPAGMVRGVEFINDSKSTNINSAWYALDSMLKPVVLIMGGVDKGNDYSILSELVKEKVKAIVCMGTDNSRIYEAFEQIVPAIVSTTSAGEAVQSAFHFAEKGDVVLLSPACASFDLFNNYEDRGIQFKNAIKEL